MIFSDLPVIDCHAHIGKVEDANLILSIMKEAGFKRMSLLSILCHRVNLNPEVIYMKAAHPDYFYIFGSIDYSSILMGLERAEPSLTEQVDALIEIGFDGIKMVEGKPVARKILKKRFDGEFYKEYFEYLEAIQFPVLFHIGDPEEFWDPEKVPEWARRMGWYYDETYPTKEELYGEVRNVLENYPRLKIIFAHFYFLSGDVERASNFLDDNGNVYLDIAPGSEMYFNFSAKREEWRDFFIQYQDRILYGTDITNGETIEGAVRHANRIKRFLETDDPIMWEIPGGKSEILLGLNLPNHVTRKIYSENFERIVGGRPRTLNLDAAIEECKRIAEIVPKLRVMELEILFSRIPWAISKIENPARYVADFLRKMKQLL